MDISDKDRLILLMLSEIHEKLEINGEIDPKFVRASILNNQLWGLAWEYAGIFLNHKENPDVVNETTEILDMYRLISTSIKKFDDVEIDQIKADAYPFSDYIEYQGFDGNNDPHLGVVEFLVRDLQRYDELQGRETLNSHSQSTLTRYRSMLNVYRNLTKPNYPSQGLNADQLVRKPYPYGSGTTRYGVTRGGG